MKKDTLLLMAFLCLSLNIFSQKKHDRIVKGHKIQSKVAIDGRLDEAAWDEAEKVSGFINWAPTPGEEPSNQTDVKLLFDDDAIYIGAYLKEQSREDIRLQLSQRDQIGNSDWFGIILDTYGNANDALEFIVTASGVQFDAKLTNGEDPNWDAVWFSNVHLTDKGWYCEIKIPYGAIRFAKTKEQKWNINFIRKVNRLEERSSWYPINPEEGVWLAQMGTTEGITDIKPPLRLSISPYVSTYAQHHSAANNEFSSTGYSYNGGMDLKYGINDAFTLDMTLIPDFGQVQSDDQVLNLSPFEIRFDEQRQFFTEGTELFNKGSLFYSRRVGGSPVGMNSVYSNLKEGEEVMDNPTKSRLLNASKVSGRTESGLGVGVFNALSNSSFATIRNSENETERRFRTAPITNYNVFVLDQSLKNNSSVSLVNTNVTRFGSDHYDANVTGTQMNFKDKGQNYSFSAEAAVSQKYYTEQENEYGLSYELGFDKISGKVNYGAEYEQTGELFDPNDLGFQRFGNIRSFDMYAVYSEFDTFGIFNRGNFWVNYSYDRIINPNEYASMHFNTGFWMQTKNFVEYNLWSNFRPASYDFYEPRIWGRFYKEKSFGNVGVYIGSDNRKKIRVQGILSYHNYHEKSRGGVYAMFRPEWQVNDKLEFGFRSNYEVSLNDPRFVTIVNDADVIFGRRNRSTVTNSITAAYTFTDKMGMDFRLRHYWSKVNYSGYNLLGQSGELLPTDYNEFNDFTFSLMNIDLNFRWRFAPGSDLILNWKNNIAGSVADNNLDYGRRNYFDDLSGLRTFPENNSVSVRLVYYLDYQQAKGMINRR